MHTVGCPADLLDIDFDVFMSASSFFVGCNGDENAVSTESALTAMSAYTVYTAAK
eukprot:CAMPEP_0202731158 /NCGR_PEP_ID=MMETSP1385-20130828/187005_1 /ASSEMBLY_ACC=CAM_ASM_000861 /TAXON_ID=933848 /ORGANISM="Elphidium margaritaceum" /LENGTH=54 /DNA_ID=CAMNT_0049397443 /DNA_START=716 /DNA_END=877 /DNA_ORIENTATION=-